MNETERGLANELTSANFMRSPKIESFVIKLSDFEL